jgi:rhamnose utilization protein RhaD (predicted bifunctional aldolase and dehydrogenase)
MTTTPHQDGEFRALLKLSAALGADPLRIQAAGGNTSIKRDGVMWIKASGAWLADALQRDMMTPVRLAPLLEAVASGDSRAEGAAAFVDTALNSSGLRPSIETSVHAVLPHAVVIHIHCVDTIALAARADAETSIAKRFGLPADEWTYVPYVKPGLSLAQAIKRRLGARTNVIVLGNHGLVVAAETVEEAADRVRSVCEALSAPPRVAPAPDLARLATIVEGSAYRLPKDAIAHATALDSQRLAIAKRGTLYPDHVVFLGPSVVEGAMSDGGLKSLGDCDGPPMLVLPGLGVVLRRDAPKGADELARCLADVTARIPLDAPIQVLTAAQERELVDWDAEKYRRALNAGAGGGR